MRNREHEEIRTPAFGLDRARHRDGARRRGMLWRLGWQRNAQRGRRSDDRRRPGRRLDERNEHLRQQFDLHLRADHATAVHRHPRRQGHPAAAGHRLHAVAGQPDLHHQAAPRCEVLQRCADDLRRREVLDRRRQQDRRYGLGLHQRRDRQCRRPRSVHRGGQGEVSVGPADRRSVAVQQRHRAEQLRRPIRRGLLHPPGRHGPVHVGGVAEGPLPEAGEEPQLLGGRVCRI